jgi:excisionase family DNA binding protein
MAFPLRGDCATVSGPRALPKKIPPKPVALSVREAADFLSVSRSRINELISAGELVAYKDGARTLILTASCEEWLERLRPFPTSPPPTGPLLAQKDRKLARRRTRDPASPRPSTRRFQEGSKSE